MSKEITAERVATSEITRVLLNHPSIEDCVTVRRQAGADQRTVAYVVCSGPFHEERLRSHVRDTLACEPPILVAVASIPIRTDGQIDIAALCAIETIDEGLLGRLQDRLLAGAGVEKAAVLAQEIDDPLPPLHLADLLPDWRQSDAADAAPSPSARAVAQEEADVSARPPAHSDGGTLHIPDGAPATFTQALLATARDHAEKGITYVSADGAEDFQSYGDLLTEARVVLAGLQSAGLKPGDRVILQIDSLRDHFTAFWACVLAGVTPVTVAVAPSYSEPNSVLNKLCNTWKLLEKPTILTSRRLVGSISGLSEVMEMIGVTTHAVEDLKQYGSSDKLYDAKPQDLVFFQLSSGSTGIPKCIQETHGAVIAHIHGSQQFNRYSPEDITLNWLPVDHVVPILTVHLKDVYLGCNEVQIKPEYVLSEPLRWLDLLEKHRATLTWAPNFGFKLIADRLAAPHSRMWNLSSVRYFMNAGEQVTLPVVRDFLKATAAFGVAEACLQPSFGMAEACTCMTYTNDFSVEHGVHRIRKSSLSRDLLFASESERDTIDFVDLGPPTPGVQIRITDGQNRLVPEGRIGRFQIKGAVITPGYLYNDAANQDAFVGDGWFNSGDLGFIWKGR
ncbi:MAG TPA: AMP-binding protein, partial [Chthonomonadales bacterium]|nr:AMP-binding protein [Chthonomonadales bacterium]